MSLARVFRIPFRIGVATLLALFLTLPAQAAQIKVEGRLIWGTNDEKFSDPKFKPVDAATAEKFRKIFQWKRYFEVNRKTTVVPSRGAGKLEMSKKCVIEITELEGPKVEVTLIGEGNPVNKTVKPLSKGESFTIAGDCKDGSAWFVLITELDEKAQ
jgi:hypothetical protein